MLLCAFLRNIYHIGKISSSRTLHLYFRKLWQLNTRYPTNFALMRLISPAHRRTIINSSFSLRKCHSHTQEVDSQRTLDAEQKVLAQETSCDKLKDEVPDEKVKIYFETSKGEKIECLACVDKNVMNASIDNDIAMHGNCNGEAICSICHVYIDEKYEEFMPKISDEEAEMLDMVPHVEENSRLSCQIIVKKELEGAVFKLPHYNEPWVVQEPDKS